jgi:hypothetical protein
MWLIGALFLILVAFPLVVIVLEDWRLRNAVLDERAACRLSRTFPPPYGGMAAYFSALEAGLAAEGVDFRGRRLSGNRLTASNGSFSGPGRSTTPSVAASRGERKRWQR